MQVQKIKLYDYDIENIFNQFIKLLDFPCFKQTYNGEYSFDSSYNRSSESLIIGSFEIDIIFKYNENNKSISNFDFVVWDEGISVEVEIESSFNLSLENRIESYLNQMDLTNIY